MSSTREWYKQWRETHPFCNEPEMFEAYELHVLIERQKLALDVIDALEQAKKAIAAVGHKHTCGFSGCTCGAVENFKIESAEFWRMVQKLNG